jgi:hypothetical protein
LVYEFVYSLKILQSTRVVGKDGFCSFVGGLLEIAPNPNWVSWWFFGFVTMVLKKSTTQF